VAAVRRVNDCPHPSWDATQRLLLRLPDMHGTQVSLEAGDDHWLIVEHVGDFGYFVCGSLPTDCDYFNLIDSRLGDAISEGDLALERTTFPRYALVGQEIMLRAARTFFESGERDQRCEWVPESDAFYQ
jgi:hypothetical protein